MAAGLASNTMGLARQGYKVSWAGEAYGGKQVSVHYQTRAIGNKVLDSRRAGRSGAGTTLISRRGPRPGFAARKRAELSA